MTEISSSLVVVSFYDRRPLAPLLDLLASLGKHTAGGKYSIAIVVNSTGDWRLPDAISDEVQHVLYRNNTGMNIGAWDAGWRAFPDYDRYLFVQDECLATHAGWLAGLLDPLDDPTVGMVGESFNHNWAKPWPALRVAAGTAVMPEHEIDGTPANRVDVYLDFMRREGIEPGEMGGHLRSLIWALRRPVLEAIDGFPQGANYGECIAAEIAVSKAIEAKGLVVRQVDPRPFKWFRHIEWNQDQPGGPYTHAPVLRRQHEARQAEIERLRASLESPTWAGWRAMTAVLLRKTFAGWC